MQREEIEREETLAVPMIRGAEYIADLSNQFVKGEDKYPKAMASAESLLELYKPPSTTRRQGAAITKGRWNGAACRELGGQRFDFHSTRPHLRRASCRICGRHRRSDTPRNHVPRRMPRLRALGRRVSWRDHDGHHPHTVCLYARAIKRKRY
jgi:hypothetical protein